VTGSLAIAAERRGGRTVIRTLRQEGLSRCSRPFTEPGGAARLVLSQLGPGFVRDDRYELDVRLAGGAELRLEAQAAGRALGSGGVSHWHARFALDRDAGLFYAGEPLIPYDGAAHAAGASVTLAPGAWLAWLDTLAPHGTFEAVASSFRAFYGDRLVIHDVMRLTPERLPEALGSAYYLRSGIDEAQTEALVAAAGALGAQLAPRFGARIGVGSAAAGGVTFRARGPQVRPVRALLATLLAAMRSIETSCERNSAAAAG
jgi:urease accessory protein UreH